MEERRKLRAAKKLQTKRASALSSDTTVTDEPVPMDDPNDKNLESLTEEMQIEDAAHDNDDAPNEQDVAELQDHIAKSSGLKATTAVEIDSDNESVATCAQGNTSNKPTQDTRHSVNDGLDGYSRAPSKHIFYCKLEMYTAPSETPTAQTKATMAMILTTILKIDTSAKIYVFKDERNKSFINNPT